MKILKSKSQLMYLVMTLLLLTSSDSAFAIGAASGYSPSYIDEGSEVSFTGTFYNLWPLDVYVLLMAVEFIEGKSSGAAGSAERVNITKSYPVTRQKLSENSSFTDVFTTTIEFEPGTYNVSIYFVSGNSSDANVWNKFSYALSNQTVTILGVNDPQKILIGFAITIGIMAVVVLGIYIYNKRKN